LFFTIIPGYLKDKEVTLRPVRLSDGPFMADGLRDRDMLETNGLKEPIRASWFFVWWWIKKTYRYSYCIECGPRRIGFIGLFNLKPDRAAEVSLAIFESAFRRNGYGTRAFRLFMCGLKGHPGIEKIIVRVRRDNQSAYSFWRSLGFLETNTSDGTIAMAMNVSVKRDIYIRRKAYG
jgi:RimJ/RimL family protein N-acetyltransferase